MKSLLSILFIALGLYSTAQCNYKVDEVDRFTGTKKLLTNDQKAYATMTNFVTFAFGKLDTTKYVDLRIGSGGDPYYIKSGETVIILFSGGSNMTLSRVSSSDVSDINAGNVLNATYILNKSELFQLQNKLITGIRVYTSQGYLESGEVKSKFAERIKTLANCI